MYPHVAIQLCTYNRPKEIKQVVEALIEHIDYPADKITLYVCDDSSPGNYTTALARNKLFKHWKTFFITTPQNSGWGANVNNGLKGISEDFIFFVEDDYVLKRPLNLRVGVALLQARTNIGMLRYRGIHGSHMVMHQFEADISPFYDGSYQATPVSGINRVNYLQLDSGSPDLYLYSHGPHLKRAIFHETHGQYPEGLKLGATEEAFAHRVKDRMRSDPNHAPAIAILDEWLPMWWDHIGVSYQNTESDK